MLEKKNQMWRQEGDRWVREIVYEGDFYVFFPGNPNTLPDKVEKMLKEIAYTSERGIDWEATQVAERVGTKVIRGVIFKLDNWLYLKLINYTQYVL